MIEWLNRKTAGTPAGVCLASALAALLHGPMAESDELPQRAADPAYGMALYEYYQGNAFEALTRLNVAAAEGGIDGHGDHPALVEGGLMLSYGMTHEAGALFQELLDEDAVVAPGTRNQAWFYLGKVFYLEQDRVAARDALERVDEELLEDEDDELYNEWLYFRGQLALAGTAATDGETVDELIEALPESSPWRTYLHYNQAVGRLAEGQTEEAIADLARLDDLLAELPELEPPLSDEMSALRERVKLSMGRLQMSRGDFSGAMANLEQTAPDGVFSDQALFDYAVAASREGRAGLALQALDTLQQRPLFTPWLQQVPYARGFLFEQMERKQQALQAYREAASHYQTLSTQLLNERDQLTEVRLIDALRFLREGDSPGQGGVLAPALTRPQPGEPTVLTDAYGRVEVRPGDYSLAGLLATEPFQLSLRDLHELYRLQNLLGQWRKQLESFGIMLETRAQKREQRIRETREALDELNADQWLARQEKYRREIEAALAREYLRFFMTKEQHELANRLAQVEQTLSQLPDDKSTRKQRQTFQRMKAYFNWRIADDYAVNRWAAEKQLRELDRAMEVFVDQRALIEQEMASSGHNQALAARVAARRTALEQLQGEVDKALSAARSELLTLVDDELQQQSREVRGYLRASRHASARLADDLFLGDGPGEVSLGEVMDSYRALLPLLEDPAKQVTVRHRLADLEFQRAENKMVETAEDEMAGAIEAYEQLLVEYPDRPGNDQVLYQLARAFDLRGMSEEHLATLDILVNEHPDSRFWVEAQFRRGDLLFSNGRYAEAEQAFRTVIDADPARRTDDSFLINAHYMLGWSQFKQGDYRNALFSYIDVLDLVMPEEQSVESVGQEYRTMMEDLFRVFGLSLSYLDGADTLQAIFRETGAKPYEILVYDRYSELLLEREQYTDAIDVFERYIDARPLSPWAPRYQMRIIDTLAQAGFPADIPERKAAFVQDYGIHSAYLQQADDDTAFYIQQQLEELIPELANRHYVLAGKTEGAESEEHYRQAAVYYEAFADTFPAHLRTPEMLFLLGETHVELAQWPEAIDAFERVAYDFPWEGEPPERAAEAGYASVLAFREYGRTWPREPAETYNDYAEFQQLNRLRFVNAFPEDARSEEVLYIAMQHEFERYRYAQVVEMADRMAARVPAPGAEILTETGLLKAHSLFELGRYAEAETTYQQTLRVMAENDQRRPDVIESLAASVFRQAEALADAGDPAGAVSEFLRVGVVAPTSALRANAEYDAATLLIELSHWQDAIDVMVTFRSRYPNHEQIDTLPARLALAYRETEQWEKAGDELNNLIAMATTDEEKRENLLIAADLYERAGNTNKAIDTWRRYANTYPEPRDVYMEAAHSLAGLYQEIGDESSRRFWLRKQMDTVDTYPDEADDRMRYLAAEASAILAREALAYYDSIRLTLPLNQSMAAKTEALEVAVTAYQKTASYGVSFFSTEAGYQIAHIYARLGRDLMDSERPEGLSELELSQYELLLEEQAYPFEDNAIDIHEQNASRARNGIFDEWVQRSYEALKTLLPGRYNKPEITVEVVDELG